MKKILTIVTLLIFAHLISSAQFGRSCSTMENLTRLQIADPSIISNMSAIESFTNDYISHSPSGSRTVVSIPVVVHVIYNTSTQNISDAQIASQITILNNDFRKLNADRTSVPSVFTGVAADCEINFCMAQRTPDGAATTGIVRVSTSSTSFIDDDRVKYTSSGGDNAWDATQYLNIWVCNLGSGLLGYAQFPGGAAATDGVVIKYTAFGNTGTAASPYNLGRTATHEIGHWLNLRHIWGDASCGSDLVTDTPTQSTSNFGCPSYPHVTCSNGPNGDMWMNYMDYTDDRCMYMFTTGQKARMQALFASGGARAGIATSAGCTPPLCVVPTGLTAGSITTTTANLSWTAVSGASSYNIQYKLSTASSWTTTTSSTNTKALTGLTAGSTYNYQIQTVCSASSSSAYSTASSFTTTALSCSVPSGLTVGSITTTGATLSWTAVSGASSYNIQYKLSTASSWTTTTSATNTKALTGLTAGSSYNFQVQTVCSASLSSAYSTAISFTTSSASCSIPSGLVATSITTSGATISWTAVSGATSYNIQYKLSTESSWTSTTSTTPTKALTALTSGSVYNYQVQTVCSASSSSAYSTASTFTTVAECGVPTGLSAGSITTTGATLSWTPVTGAISYNIQYKLSTSSSWTTTTSTTATKALTSLSVGTIYNYQIQTVCSASSSSAYSAPSTFTTTACIVPTGLAAGSITTTTVTLSWTAVTGATGYNVQYKLSTASSWTTTTASTASKALTGLTAGSVYNYQIQTVCSASSTSDYSTAATFTTTDPPCGADSYEPNNSLSAYRAISNNTNYLAYICPTGDEDWYRFTTTSAARNFRVTLTTLPTDYDLYVYNSSGTLLGSSTNSGTTSELYALNGGVVGSYYIRVAGYSGAYSPTLRYTLQALTSSSTLRMEGTAEEDPIEDIVDENTGFIVYPNPAIDHFVVSYNSTIDGTAVVNIYDAMGKLISVSPFNVSIGLNQTELNTNELSNGFYFVVLQDGNAKYSTKILVSK